MQLQTITFLSFIAFMAAFQMKSPLLSTRSLQMVAADPMRTFAAYVVYKGKAALSFKIIHPSYSKVGPQSRTVNKEGGILLEFAPTGSQPREYDWSKKASFLLDATECGELLIMPKDTKNGIDFVHDPNMGGEKSGQVTKKLRTAPMADGKGFFMTLSVNDKSASPLSYSVPVSNAEFEVLRQIMSYAVPRLLGFHDVWMNPGLGDSVVEMAPAPPAAPLWKKLT
jgi:hypothetical protein